MNFYELQEEEHRLRDEHIAYQEQEAEAARHRQQEILMREEEAKKRVARNLKEKRRIIKRREVPKFVSSYDRIFDIIFVYFAFILPHFKCISVFNTHIRRKIIQTN